MKKGGGNAGRNGLRSVTAHLGNDYRRVRLGIGHPGDKSLVHSFVLNDFGRGEMQWVEALCEERHRPQRAAAGERRGCAGFIYRRMP